MSSLPKSEPVIAGGESAAFGRWLREAREEREITQQALADRAGISRSYLSDLERGRDVHPTLPTLERLATALGIPNLEALRAVGLVQLPTRDAQRQEEDRLLARYRGLSESGRDAVERFVRFVYQEEQRWIQPAFPDVMFEHAEVGSAPPHDRPLPISLFDAARVGRSDPAED